MLTSKEKDDDRARRVAEDGCVLRTLVGSTVHGLGNPATDDRDEMGVCVEPKEYILGLREFEHFVYRTQPEGNPSGPGDLDLTIYSLRKWCRLAMRGSPTVLLLLFVTEPDHVLLRTQLGEELQALAPALVSRRTGEAFLGYLASQRAAFDHERPRTREQSSVHGYDTKYAMHSLRIAYQGHELLTTGTITLPVPEPARSRLMAVRHGEPSLPELTGLLDDAESALRRAIEASRLPAQADRDRVNEFLVAAYERTWAADTGRPR